MDGWNTNLSFWVSPHFQVRLLLVSGRVILICPGILYPRPSASTGTFWLDDALFPTSGCPKSCSWSLQRWLSDIQSWNGRLRNQSLESVNGSNVANGSHLMRRVIFSKPLHETFILTSRILHYLIVLLFVCLLIAHSSLPLNIGRMEGFCFTIPIGQTGLDRHMEYKEYSLVFLSIGNLKTLRLGNERD